MRTAIYILLALLLGTRVARGQEAPFAFSNLKEKDGLSHPHVYSLLHDSRGYLWVSTGNGLSRFDGSHFYVFRKKKQGNSIPHEIAHQLCEDTRGRIWGATPNGVFCYTPGENRFRNYYLSGKNTDNNFLNISSDKEGTVWVTNNSALLKIDSGDSTLKPVVRFTDQTDSVWNFLVRKNGLLSDPGGKGYWIALRAGLFYYNKETGKTSSFFTQPHHPLFRRRNVSALAVSPRGHYWLFDNDRRVIEAFDPASQTILRKIPVGPQMPEAYLSTLFEDSQERLWLSSWSFEAACIDLRTNSFTHIRNRSDDSRSIAADFFWTSWEDTNGTIWLGTPGGLSRCNPGKTVYQAYQLPYRIPELRETVITLMEEDPADKSWWIATGNLKLIRYVPETGACRVYDYAASAGGMDLPSQTSFTKLTFLRDRILVCTNRGSRQIRRGGQGLEPISFLPADLSRLNPTNIITDGDSLLYLTEGRQLFSWQPQGELSSAAVDRTPAIHGFSTAHQLQYLGKNWLPVWNNPPGQLILFHKKDNTPFPIRYVRNDTLEAGGYISCIRPDKNGQLWVASNGVGLYRINPVNGEVRYWTDADGLADNYVQKLGLDDRGHIWTVNYNNVSVFDTARASFVTFRIPYSESRGNYDNWLIRRQNGNILISIANDIFECFPDRLNQLPKKTKTLISVITVSGKDFLSPGNTRLKLASGENDLRIRFGLLLDQDLYPHRFEYQLEGVDPDFMEAGNTNEAVYNKLPPGNYTFRVRARGKNGAWKSEEAILTFRIKTPFYKSRGFILAIIAVLAGILYALYRYRLRQKGRVLELENRAQKLEKEKVLAMYENLKQQLNPHFLFNSLSSLSGLIETNQEKAGDFLGQMSGIYRYILKNADRETVTLREEIEFVQLYINLQKTRFREGLQVDIRVPEEDLHYKIAPVSLQNMIENAIKHNIIDQASPLKIEICTEEPYLVVTNNLQRKNVVETSNQRGLDQFRSLYSFLSETPVLIEETPAFFRVKIPLL